jgi:Ran GTPase-activating protein (RanGAP) involved in mRNA processing and transport
MALGFLILANPAQAIKYSNIGVVDDEIASGIRDPKPPSVTKVIEDIKARNYLTKHKDLNLSGNNISTSGVTQILSFIADNANNLERLDLSYNLIYKETAEDVNFNQALKKVVALPSLLEIDLSGNGIGELSWLQQMIAELGEDGKKIKI